MLVYIVVNASLSVSYLILSHMTPSALESHTHVFSTDRRSYSLDYAIPVSEPLSVLVAG